MTVTPSRTQRLLLRRRRIDSWLLSFGILFLGLLISAGKFAFLFFVACGIYLAIRRPRSRRDFPLPFSLLLIGWAVWQVGLSLLRGEPVEGNRALTYAGTEFALAFLPLGLCLVRDPVGALANGARACLILLTIIAPVAFFVSEDRVGLGGNEAIFAYVIGVIALISRLPVRRPLRLLPNGWGWAYLVIVPVLLSGTRAAFGIVVLIFASDLLRIAFRHRPAWTRTRWGLPVVAGFALVAAIGFAAVIQNRVEAGVAEVEAFQRTGIAVGSVDTRMAMWSAGWQVLLDHPVLGVGGTRRMEAAGEKAGANGYMVTYYHHLHNMFLDEALSSGLVGVALMLGVFAGFLYGTWRAPPMPRFRSTALILTAFTLIFGSFHGVLLNEWMLIALFGTMGCMLTTARRAEARRG